LHSQIKIGHEANISAIQKKEKEQARLQGKDVNRERAECPVGQAQKRTQEADGLRRTEAQSIK